MSGNKTDFFKQMRMIVEGHDPLMEQNNTAVVGILVNIVNTLGVKDDILPLLAAKMNGESTTLHEENLTEGRGWVKTVVGAIIGLAMALGGNAIMNIVQRMGGVPEEHRIYDVPMGSDVTGAYWGYRDDRLRESSSSFFHRMKAIVEGAYDSNANVVVLLADLISAIGAKEEFLDTAEAEGVINETILEESDRRGILAALLALILAFGAMIVNNVGARLAGRDDWIPMFDSSGNIAAYKHGSVYDPGRPE